MKEKRGSAYSMISPDDFLTVCDALNILEKQLSDALSIFQSASHGGRSGALKAMRAVTQFLAVFDSIRGTGLLVPIVTLNDALDCLNEGTVQPMLVPIRKSGRGTSSGVYAVAQAVAVHSVDCLIAIGLPLEEACQNVATVLNNLKIRPSRGKNAQWSQPSLKKLRERAHIDLIGETLLGQAVAVLRNDTSATPPKDLTPDAAKQWIMDKLATALGQLRLA